MFFDRTDAGIQLGKALGSYRGQDIIILAIPRGGAEIGYQVATALNAPFSLIISRKLPFPDEPEAGFGAVSEDGSSWLIPGHEAWLRSGTIEEIVTSQIAEIRRRIDVLRGGRDLPDIKGKIVILVDDGVAMGSTMRASVACCRNLGAAKVVVAVPVTGEETARELETIADDVIVLEMPHNFRAVAQVYENWYDVPDEEVLEIMNRS
ncbi:phosphoribosyltransferase [bacterium]|nr:MAG: phosphoribosyltransferase [bacterium]